MPAFDADFHAQISKIVNFTMSHTFGIVETFNFEIDFGGFDFFQVLYELLFINNANISCFIIVMHHFG